MPLTADSKFIVYADDILLYRPVHSAADRICPQEDTTSLGATASPLLLNAQPVDFVDSIRYLGLTISTDLSWSKHHLQSKATSWLTFRQFYKPASTNTIRKLYLTVVQPHFVVCL